MSIYDLSLASTTMRILLVGVAGVQVAWLTARIAGIVSLTPPSFGILGKRRSLARREFIFQVAEPWILFLAGGLSRLSFAERLRTALAPLVIRAGFPLGLRPVEWLALSVGLFLGGSALVVLGVAYGALGAVWVPMVCVGCTLLPWLHLRGLAADRSKQLERSLPSAMDLCVLCMGAGADFPAALRLATLDLGIAHRVCQEELSIVLDELQLGRTRVDALTALGNRSASPAVRDFVSAVCQSEMKGTPLVDALDLQAKTLRQRRSVLAEEAAAQAGVRLLFPLMLLMLCVLLIVLGPLFVQGGGM